MKSADTILTNPGFGDSANPAYLTALRVMSTENETPLEKAEKLLEHKRLQLVLRMTPRRFAELSAVERRNYARWSKHFAKVFQEAANMMERNSTAEPELPRALERITL